MSETIERLNFIFKDMIFTHVDRKKSFDLYSCRIPTSFSNGKKCFIIAFVVISDNPAPRSHLHDLEWKTVSTRTLGEDEITEAYNHLIEQKWSLPPPSPEINPRLHLVERADRVTKYILDDESEVVLLHDISKNTKYQYENTMRLVQALLTMKCIVTPKEHKIIQVPEPKPPKNNIQWV